MSIVRMNKVFEDGQLLIVSEIRLPSGGTFKIKDQDGFTVAEITDTGDLVLKGNVRRV